MMMSKLLILGCIGVVFSKPQFGAELSLTEGRIIGGEEAPKRMLCVMYQNLILLQLNFIKGPY